MSKLQEKIEKYEQELVGIDNEWEERQQALQQQYAAERGAYLSRKQSLVDMLKDLKELLSPEETSETEEKEDEVIDGG